jgi:hypothetical protein
VIRSRKKWSESAILKILSPVRLPFRHAGNVNRRGNFLKRRVEMQAAVDVASMKPEMRLIGFRRFIRERRADDKPHLLYGFVNYFIIAR